VTNDRATGDGRRATVSEKRGADLSLYLVVGPGDTRGLPLREVVLAAVEGGVTAVQLRCKHHSARDFIQEARALVAELRPRGIPLIVNDRVDVALAVGADGVHVGQDDLAAPDVRRMVGEDLLLGLSVTSLAEAFALDPAIVDYAGVGPVFATPTKPDAAPPLGLGGTRAICDALSVPAVAIGGIGLTNAADVLTTGVAGIAVISAICGAESPRAGAAQLAALTRAARARSPL
jgi:thiamine-phosphate pyrophosphorylase